MDRYNTKNIKIQSLEYNLKNFPLLNSVLFIYFSSNKIFKSLFSPFPVLRQVAGGENMPVGRVLVSIVINPERCPSSKYRSAVFVILNCELFLAQMVFLLIADREHKGTFLVVFTVLPMLFKFPTHRSEASNYFVL